MFYPCFASGPARKRALPRESVTPKLGFSAIGAFSTALILRRPLPKATGLEGCSSRRRLALPWSVLRGSCFARAPQDEGAAGSCVNPKNRSRSYPFPVERGLFALAVNLERALVADGVRTLEDPVLPGGEAAEDAGIERLRTVEAQVRLERSQG